MNRNLVLLIPFALAIGLAQEAAPWDAPPEAKKLKNKVALIGEKMGAVRKLYVEKCVACHGITGNSDGPAVKAMPLPKEPANFTNSKVMNKAKDGELFWKISTGRAPMPGFEKELSDTDRWQLVNYVRYLTERSQYHYLGYRRTPGR
jgi:mono/diheme cytochrome c family protein